MTLLLPRGNLNIGGHVTKNIAETFALFDNLRHLFHVGSYTTGGSSPAATVSKVCKSGLFRCQFEIKLVKPVSFQ